VPFSTEAGFDGVLFLFGGGAFFRELLRRSSSFHRAVHFPERKTGFFTLAKLALPASPNTINVLIVLATYPPPPKKKKNLNGHRNHYNFLFGQ
jgi:hypothetical protein